ATHRPSSRSRTGRRTVPSLRRVARNLRLLLDSSTQHMIDDPAILVVQVSRRLPMAARVRAGRLLRATAGALPGAQGVAARGAFRAAETVDAQRLLASDPRSLSTVHGEVSVMLDQPELLSDEAPATTRARSAWYRGAMSEAVEILERAGLEGSAYARRL